MKFTVKKNKIIIYFWRNFFMFVYDKKCYNNYVISRDFLEDVKFLFRLFKMNKISDHTIEYINKRLFDLITGYNCEYNDCYAKWIIKTLFIKLRAGNKTINNSTFIEIITILEIYLHEKHEK